MVYCVRTYSSSSRLFLQICDGSSNLVDGDVIGVFLRRNIGIIGAEGDGDRRLVVRGGTD